MARRRYQASGRGEAKLACLVVALDDGSVAAWWVSRAGARRYLCHGGTDPRGCRDCLTRAASAEGLASMLLLCFRAVLDLRPLRFATPLEFEDFL